MFALFPDGINGQTMRRKSHRRFRLHQDTAETTALRPKARIVASTI
jgi:hypothetical protein